jgi:hypothetical protein
MGGVAAHQLATVSVCRRSARWSTLLLSHLLLHCQTARRQAGPLAPLPLRHAMVAGGSAVAACSWAATSDCGSGGVVSLVEVEVESRRRGAVAGMASDCARSWIRRHRLHVTWRNKD